MTETVETNTAASDRAVARMTCATERAERVYRIVTTICGYREGEGPQMPGDVPEVLMWLLDEPLTMDQMVGRRFARDERLYEMFRDDPCPPTPAFLDRATDSVLMDLGFASERLWVNYEGGRYHLRGEAREAVEVYRTIGERAPRLLNRATNEGEDQ